MEPADRVLALIEETTAGAVSGPAPSTMALTQAIEQTEDELAFARWTLSVLNNLEEQRSRPALKNRLEMLDDLINSLVKADSIGTSSRPLFTVLWKGDTALPSVLLGAGPVGIAAIRPDEASSVTGTALLARAAAFDAIASTPELRANLRDAIMVGPLAGRRAQPPFYARGNFEPIVAMACWAPALAADLVAAILMGPSYGKSLIETEWRRGLNRRKATAIAPDRGLYSAEPPLWIRLTAVDTALQRDGDTSYSVAKELETKLQLQGELTYQMPNGTIRRLLAEPMLDLVRKVSVEFLQARLSALGERTLNGILTTTLHTTDSAGISAAGRAFLRNAPPTGEPPVHLWLGAMEAELEIADGKTSMLDQLSRALAGPERTAVAAPGVRIGGDTLLRDAYVLSEIL